MEFGWDLDEWVAARLRKINPAITLAARKEYADFLVTGYTNGTLGLQRIRSEGEVEFERRENVALEKLAAAEKALSEDRVALTAILHPMKGEPIPAAARRIADELIKIQRVHGESAVEPAGSGGAVFTPESSISWRRSLPSRVHSPTPARTE